MLDDENDPIIIDLGSDTLKAGFASDDNPKVLMPMMLGEPKAPGILVGMDQKDYYVGFEAQSKQTLLNMRYPVKKGKICYDVEGRFDNEKDFQEEEEKVKDDIRKMIDHLMNNELSRAPDEHKVLITEPPNNSPKLREDLCSLMFEEFNVPKFYLGNQAVLSLFATGRTTGTVVDAGEGITHTVPIYEGYAIPHAITEIPLSGFELTQYMYELIQQKHQDSELTFDVLRDNCRELKEKYCKVAIDFDAEMKTAQESSALEKTYILPNSKQIVIKQERIQCPEMLFQPSYANKSELDGIHKYTYDSIMKCDNDIKKELFKSIVLAGGCTMFENMKERMKKEIQALAPSTMGPEVDAPADRKHSAWLGGAILSLIEKFEPMWITKAQFAETGPQIVHRQCF